MTEETSDLLAAAWGDRRRGVLVPELHGFGVLVAAQFTGGVREHQVAAGGYGFDQLIHNRDRLVGVENKVQDSQHHDHNWLGEVQCFRRGMQNLVGVAGIGVDVVGGALNAADEQGTGVHQDQGIIVDVDDP